jgi:hypothetical protein
MVSANDTTPDYLVAKIKAPVPAQNGITITVMNSGANEYLLVQHTGTFKVSVNDTTPGYLSTKLTSGDFVVLSTTNPGGNEARKIDLQWNNGGLLSTPGHVAPTGTDNGRVLTWDGFINRWIDNGELRWDPNGISPGNGAMKALSGLTVWNGVTNTHVMSNTLLGFFNAVPYGQGPAIPPAPGPAAFAGIPMSPYEVAVSNWIANTNAIILSQKAIIDAIRNELKNRGLTL